MSTGNIDDVNPPRAMNNIVQEVMEYVKRHSATDITPVQFETYDRALFTVWPELYKADRKAYLLVAVSIYIEISERWHFADKVPAALKELRL